MTINLTSKTTYRTRLNNLFGFSLQAYSLELQKWSHIGYFKPYHIEAARARYNETMRYEAHHTEHVRFSINNLLETKRLNDRDPRQEITDMLAGVCHILDISLEVL